MLLKLKVKNYYSFRDEVEIDFSSHKNDTLKAAKIMAFKGQNGAGKTNLLKALTFLTVICGQGYKVLQGAAYSSMLNMDTFYFNDQPSSIMVEFLIKNIHYRYELSFKEGEIISEKISIFTNDKFELVINREFQEFKYLSPKFKELYIIKIKSDLSVIPLHDMYNFGEELDQLKEINTFFSKFISNISPKGYYDVDLSERLEEATISYKDNKDLLNLCSSIINSIDSSIVSVTIKSAKDQSGEDVFFPVFKHIIDGVDHYLPLYKESSGIKKIYALAEHIIGVISNDGILIADELDGHLHCSSIATILSLFKDQELGKGQIMFTAHSQEVINLVDSEHIYEIIKANNVSKLAC